MNKLERDNYRLWNTKHISEPDDEWYILKFFKKSDRIPSIERQKTIIADKIKYFWEYIPETELIEFENWEYYIRQKFIEWKTLAQTDVSDLSAETLSKLIDLIKKYIQYFKEQGWVMDTTGYQLYRWNICNLERRFRQFLAIDKNFLTSTNIMISKDWNVYMVDVCESADSRILWKIKNFCAKPFIKRTISSLERNLQQKLEFEKELIQSDLSEVLSD